MLVELLGSVLMLHAVQDVAGFLQSACAACACWALVLFGAAVLLIFGVRMSSVARCKLIDGALQLRIGR